MALTKEQVQVLGYTRPASREPHWNEEAQTRGSLRDPRQLWPNGIIPYIISPEIGIILLFHFILLRQLRFDAIRSLNSLFMNSLLLKLGRAVLDDSII